MGLKNLFIIYICKIVYYLVKLFGLGGGSTWPGHLALKLNPKFIEEVLSDSSLKIILVAGTNGKTTTTKLLRYILEKNSVSTLINEEGANLLNGVVSAIVSKGIKNKAVIFEIDENTLPQIISKIKPFAIILLNIFRDQLDRYGEVNTIASKWRESFKKLPKETLLIINADDPRLGFIGRCSKQKVYYFGLSDKYFTKKEIPHDVDSVYCPSCGSPLNYYAMSYSHLGSYSCNVCGFKRPQISKLTISNNIPLAGTYNIYNIYAAVLCAHLGFKISVRKLLCEIQDFKPAFGRQEAVEYKGRKIFILLSKNPTGFNQSIETLLTLDNDKKDLLVVLNDRIPDGRDVSWIWDVEFEKLLNAAKSLTVSGDRPYDMALRFKYCFDSPQLENQKINVVENLEEAIKTAVGMTAQGKTLYVLATYSAMLEVRKIIFGRKLL